MPRTTTREIDAYAHCPNARCAGYTQQPVKALEDTVEFTYVDGGGDMPGVEKSQVYLRFADEKEMPCPAEGCNLLREVTAQQRKAYQPLSGHDPQGLLHFKPPEVFAT